jgi:hypothetical protein
MPRQREYADLPPSVRATRHTTGHPAWR